MEGLDSSGIYRIVHSVSGKEYIGSAVNLRKRWLLHRTTLQDGRHHSRHLQNAWNKHGADAFAFEVLEIVEDRSLLLVREQCYLDTRKPVYNCSPTAGSLLGYRYSPESRLRVRAAVTRSWQNTKERRALHRLKALAQWDNPDEREKKVAGMRGRVMNEETKAKLRAANLGKKASPETRAKMRAQRAGVPQGPHSAETRKRIGDAQHGKKRPPRSAETCAKLSSALKGKPKSAEHIAKMRAAMQGRTQSAETIAKANASRAATRERKRLEAMRPVQLALLLPVVQSPHQQP